MFLMKFRCPLLILVLMFSLNGCASNWVELDVLVQEEDGAPIEGADIKGSFITDEIDNGVKRSSHRDVTDIKGMGKVAGEEEIYVDFLVSKAGYYQSTKRKVVNQEKRGLVDILLRPKRNPIPMYAKTVVLNASAKEGRSNGEPFGFDLLAGDFVHPHGKGLINDLLITHSYQKKDSTHYSFQIKIEFADHRDGLVPFYIDDQYRISEFRSENLGPRSGYVNQLSLNKTRDGKKTTSNLDKSRNYYVRIRTVVDGNGNIESAHYGKIYGEFPSITYYLNPTPNDRNIEFDLARNLFRDIKPAERPRSP